MSAAKRTPKQDAALLEEVRTRFDYASRSWQDVRDEGNTDMRYVGGDPWDPKDRLDRESAGRPCISSDELGQYINQSVNEVRANPRAAKFSPVGNGADDKTARFYGNKWREIEYRSNAQTVYTTAFENCVQRSYGWARLTMGYPTDRSFNKELSLEAIANPNTILSDPDAMKPDSSDMKYLFCFETPSVKEFQRDYPWATIQNFGPDLIRESGGWISEEKVRLAEYWKIDTRERTLVLWVGGDNEPKAMFEDEGTPGKGWKAKLRRAVDYPSVVQHLTNGVEILKTTPWKGKAIPFASCYGKVLYIDDGSGAKRVILSLTRLARDPYMADCWTLSNLLEAEGMITKNPYWAYKGQLTADDLNEIKKSLHEPVAVLQANAYLNGETSGTPLPLPQRNPLAADVGGYVVSEDLWRRKIQAAMGLSALPTAAQRQNQKSGKALDKIDDSYSRGAYHFLDSYNHMIRRLAEMGEDLMDKTIDASRDVTVMKADMNSETVKVRVMNPGDPMPELAKDEYSVKGDHAVTISIGPEFESEREEAGAFGDTLMSSPQALQVMGPETSKKVLALVVKLKNLGPIGDQIADAISPPQPGGPDGQPIPPQIAEHLQLAEQTIEKAKEEIQQLEHVIETKQVESAADYKKAELDAKTRIKVAEIQALSRSEQTHTTTDAKIHDTNVSAEVALQIQRMESRMKALEIAHKARQADRDHEHDTALASAHAYHAEEQAALGHERALEASELGHTQNLEAGQQAHTQGLEAQEQAAALEPQDEATE